jgi:CubicO group peptidase (beta-lactamase class C family)
MVDRGLFPGPHAPEVAPDEYVRRLAELPLAAQPGSTWLYHTGSDLLGVLLARATGRSVSELLVERVTGPLGLAATGFWTAADRLPTAYQPEDGVLHVVDPPDGRFSTPPVFESLAAGLVSTAPDVLALLTAVETGDVLRPDTVRRMTTEAITAAQRAPSADFLGDGLSWGLHVGVRPALGRWGWDGGSGTSAWADPRRDAAAVLLTQRGFAGPEDEPRDFWSAVHDA